MHRAPGCVLRRTIPAALLVPAGLFAVVLSAAAAAPASNFGVGGFRVDSAWHRTVPAGANIPVTVSARHAELPAELEVVVGGHPRYRARRTVTLADRGESIDIEIRTVALSGDYLRPGRYPITLAVSGADAPPVTIGEVTVTGPGAGTPELTARIAAHKAYLESNRRGVPRSTGGTSPPSIEEEPGSAAVMVPDPFEPIVREGRAITVTGHRIVLADSGLPASIHAAGQVVSPSETRWLAGGDPGAVSASRLHFERDRPDRVAWTAESDIAGMRIRTEGSLEFDGFLHYRVTLSPDEPTSTLVPLALRIPVAAEHARYLSRLGGGTVPPRKHEPDWSLAQEYDASETRAGCESLPFAFQHIVSGDTAGLLFAVESDRDWRIADRARNFRVCRGTETAAFEAYFIDHLASAERSITLEFALQPLPVKPLPGPERMSEFNPAQFPDAGLIYRRGLRGRASAASSLRHVDLPARPGLSAWEAAVSEGLRTLVVHQEWTELQGYPGSTEPERLAALRRLVDDAHRSGLKVLVYVGLELSEAAPEWPALVDRIATLPLRFGRSRGSVRSVRPSGGSPEYARFLVRHLRLLRQRTGIDGVFLDLVPEPQVSMNEAAGMGYRTADGGFRGTLPAFGNRRLLKAIYGLFHERPDEPGVVACHAGGPQRPGHAFCDYMLAGETEMAESRRRPERMLGDLMEPIHFRIIYSPTLRGVPVIWLSKPRRGGFSMEANAAVTLLHDVPQRTQWPHFIPADAPTSILNPPDDVYRQWRVWQSGAIARFGEGRRYPYWSNAAYIDGVPPEVHVTFRVEERLARITAIVSNLKAVPTLFDLRVDAAALGIDVPLVEVRDLLGDDPPVLHDGAVRLAIPAESFRVIALAYGD